MAAEFGLPLDRAIRRGCARRSGFVPAGSLDLGNDARMSKPTSSQDDPPAYGAMGGFENTFRPVITLILLVCSSPLKRDASAAVSRLTVRPTA